jgi:hypothetical protein
MGGIDAMSEEPSEMFRGDSTSDMVSLRNRLLETSLGLHRANQAMTRTYAETDRLASFAGEPWSREWCRVVELRERAALCRARNVYERVSDEWEALVAQVLRDARGDGPRSLFTSEEVAELLVFVLGERMSDR